MSCASTTINETTLENLVKCAICLDHYDDPRLLPCSHTFCYKCIQNLCSEGMGQCPMRDNSIIFLHTIDQLPINRIAKDLVESIDKSPSPQIKCDHCKLILSEFICETCSKTYCTICLKLEHNINQFKTHSINIIIKQISNNLCSEHLEEKLKYWCLSCEQTVCSDCLLFKHKQHSFVTLQDMKQKVKVQLQSSIQQFNIMKKDLEKLNDKTTEGYHTHYQTHLQTKKSIENIFKNLQNILEERKNDLIDRINQKDVEQQNIIQEHKTNIEEHLKVILIRQLFTSQLLNCEDSFQLIQIKEDFNNYNQLIIEQYQLLMQGSTVDLQHFQIDHNLITIKQQIQHLGQISTETFLTNTNHIYSLLTLSQLSDEEKYQELDRNYAYGYRFYLNKPFKINGLRIKVKLYNSDLTVLILDYNDIIIQKQILKENSPILKWITIPIICQIERNYSILILTQSNEGFIPLVAFKDSDHNLRQINEHVSVRSKRAQINKSTNIDINTKVNVLYDALFNCNEEKEVTIPAIEMILHI